MVTPVNARTPEPVPPPISALLPSPQVSPSKLRNGLEFGRIATVQLFAPLLKVAGLLPSLEIKIPTSYLLAPPESDRYIQIYEDAFPAYAGCYGRVGAIDMLVILTSLAVQLGVEPYRSPMHCVKPKVPAIMLNGSLVALVKPG